MESDNRYLYIQQCGIKVKLLAENGIWEWKIDDVKVKMRAAVERELVYSLHTGDDLINFYELLRSCSKKLEKFGMEKLRSEFNNLHQCEEIDDYNLHEVPTYADDNGLELIVTAKSSLIISQKDENTLLEIVCRDAFDEEVAASYLDDLCNKYGYDFSKKTGYYSQEYFLLYSFLHQHGISYNSLVAKDNNKEPSNDKDSVDNDNNIAFVSADEYGFVGFLELAAFITIILGLINEWYPIALLFMNIVGNLSSTKSVFTKKMALFVLPYGIITTIIFLLYAFTTWPKNSVSGMIFMIGFLVSVLNTARSVSALKSDDCPKE